VFFFNPGERRNRRQRKENIKQQYRIKRGITGLNQTQRVESSRGEATGLLSARQQLTLQQFATISAVGTLKP